MEALKRGVFWTVREIKEELYFKKLQVNKLQFNILTLWGHVVGGILAGNDLDCCL